MMYTNDRFWLTNKVLNLDIWNVTQCVKWWRWVLNAIWHSHLPFRAKVFLWRVMVGGLPLGTTLKWRHILNETCFFEIVIKEDDKYKFITCPIAKAIWVVISQVLSIINKQRAFCYLLNGFSLMVLDLYPPHHRRHVDHIEWDYPNYLIEDYIKWLGLISYVSRGNRLTIYDCSKCWTR